MSTSPTASPASALQRIREAIPQLNPTARRIAEAILADPLGAGDASITALAATAETSPAAVSRFSRRVGYTGFPALRSAIALDNGRAAQSGWERDIGTAITPSDAPRDVLDILAGTAARALRDAAAVVDLRQIERAAEAITRAERVHLHGEWGDSVAVRELYLRLLRIGVAVWCHETGPRTLDLVAGTFTERDAVLVLNRSGDDDTALHLVQAAQRAGSTTIAVHGVPGSVLEESVDVPVYTGIRNGTVWTQHFAGRASDTLVTSMLWLLVAQRRSADPTLRFVDDGTLGDLGDDAAPDDGR
ncbi:MurR/RpiR family transcriptional regulator [Brachybacterium sacelli]|uniref:DNA-binding MurR/RpiR family transcriptional regulator n=1 Tax=Brachybacterium sacelli TaxID=173364 RepID=A0ABS4WXU2_9MICO|nr:MurR/RpiR family transcriptional regulator [Brachybacterium sacelli]MBP2381017.1 DNA-binding MurR/RpiR family transcriptional regulator [Brachybacterium sacelli]